MPKIEFMPLMKPLGQGWMMSEQQESMSRKSKHGSMKRGWDNMTGMDILEILLFE